MKVALIADVHANLPALDAVFHDIDRQGADHILFAGDAVGYYYWPAQVVDRLCQDERVQSIRGNHEDIFEEFVANQESRARYRRKYGSGYDVAVADLGEERTSWLAALPRRLEVTIDGWSILVSHGSLQSTDTYLYPDAGPADLEANYADADLTVFGHTHYAFMRASAGRIMVNPGSVGQGRDGGGGASYAVLNTANGSVQFRRCAYDTASVMAAAQQRDPELPYLWKVLTR